MERGNRKQTSRSTNHLTSRKPSPTPPQPSPSIRIDGEGERDGGFNRVFKPIRASKEWAISSASTNPAPLVSSSRQRSAGRGLWRGELANRHRDQRTISHPESSVPPLPDPPHQSGLMEREKETVGSIEFLNHFEPRRNGPFQAHPPTRRLWFPRPASGARGEDYGEGEKQHWVCGGFYNLKRQGETCSKTEMRPEASLKSCLKIRKDAVFVPKPVWLGETREHTPRGSATGQQQRQTGLGAKKKSPVAAPSPILRQAQRSMGTGQTGQFVENAFRSASRRKMACGGANITTFLIKPGHGPFLNETPRSDHGGTRFVREP